MQTETPDTTESDEFNSFQFWRDPLPCLDSELLALLVSGSNRKSGIISSFINQLRIRFKSRSSLEQNERFREMNWILRKHLLAGVSQDQ